MREPLWFAFKALALSALVASVAAPLSGVLGMMVYLALDGPMHPDDLAAFMLFFVPCALFGVPALIGGSALVLRRRYPLLVIGLYALPVLLGTLGFAGFWVGAMGI